MLRRFRSIQPEKLYDLPIVCDIKYGHVTHMPMPTHAPVPTVNGIFVRNLLYINYIFTIPKSIPMGAVQTGFQQKQGNLILMVR